MRSGKRPEKVQVTIDGHYEFQKLYTTTIIIVGFGLVLVYGLPSVTTLYWQTDADSIQCMTALRNNNNSDLPLPGYYHED